jgi:shikimate dehydrogenase
MEISGKTRVCAIIGDPVIHSLSPAIHNAAFKELGINFVYMAFTVTNKELMTAIMGVRSLGIKGLNVTMPHKNAVIKYLDDVDMTAKEIGAVNTILSSHGKLIGYNTDGIGAMVALQKNGLDLKRKKLVLLGAGGAAKAIAYNVVRDVDELVIINRTPEKATIFVNTLRKSVGKKVKSRLLSFPVLKEELNDAHILINATSVGMYPKSNISPVPSCLLRSDLNVMDIVYNPLETRLVLESKSLGAKVVSGLEMLIYQGAVAFEIWTNISPPIEVMKDAALSELEKRGVFC